MIAMEGHESKPYVVVLEDFRLSAIRVVDSKTGAYNFSGRPHTASSWGGHQAKRIAKKVEQSRDLELKVMTRVQFAKHWLRLHDTENPV